ncbi:serine/threonine-protein kinase [Planococcus soli]|uniref:serine/threonine-protein kinase n=1 Tax=Planococcus soli TaxID=2666072 RepID=UPI00115CCDED|nr:serine/threonine-protein kinase [Planococcus soli]
MSTILKNKYSLLSTISEMTNSKVYQGELIGTENKVAIKHINNGLQQLTSEEIKEVFNRDSKALSMISHENVIRYFESFEENSNLYIVMEMFDSVTLHKFILENEMKKEEMLNIFLQILHGIEAAHEKQIIHRDLKPTNILIDFNQKVKIIDFGISKIMNFYSNSGATLKGFSSAIFSAPEVISGGSSVTVKSDIYSLGVILYMMLTKEEPPEDRRKLFDSINNLGVEENLTNVLLKCLNIDPSYRFNSVISIIEVINREIDLSRSTGSAVLFIPPNQMRPFSEYGKVSNASFNSIKMYVEHSLNDATIYKTSGNYYLIGDGIKYQITIDKERGILKLLKIFPIKHFHELDFEKAKGIEFNLNLSITNNFKTAYGDKEELSNLIKNINTKYEAFTITKKEVESKNRLIDAWTKTIEELRKYNNNRINIGVYESIDFDYETNILTVTFDHNFNANNVQYGDKIRLENNFQKHETVGEIKEVNSKYIKVGLFSEVDIAEISSRGRALLDVSDSIDNTRRYNNVLNKLRNNLTENKSLMNFLVNPQLLSMNSQVVDLNFANENLDAANKIAVTKAMRTNDLFLIQGPPGTGKSTVITEIVNQIFLENNESKVLITSPSHVAVDHLLKNILVSQEEKTVVRIGTSEKIDKASSNLLANEQLKSWAKGIMESSLQHTEIFIKERSDNDKILTRYMKHYLHDNEKIKIDDIDPDIFNEKDILLLETIKAWKKRLLMLTEFDDIFAREASIVASTCAGISTRHALRNLTYDWVIIDEAARATAPELLLPMILGKKIILVGDHRQLPPIISLANDSAFESKIDMKALEKSLFEDVFEKSSDESKITLQSQFRMHRNISELIRHCFYPTYNISTKIADNKRVHNLEDSLNILWLDTSTLKDNKQHVSESGSFRNLSEVQVIKKELELLNEIYKKKNIYKEVAVISGYNAQKKLLIDYIEPEIQKWTNLTLKIDNIDAFQGSECDIVFFSMVRSNDEGNLGFLRDYRRINVALSRGKSRLYIVGNKEFIYKGNQIDPNFSKIVAFINTHPEYCIVKEATL